MSSLKVHGRGSEEVEGTCVEVPRGRRVSLEYGHNEDREEEARESLRLVSSRRAVCLAQRCATETK